jgi:hypothetical protein
MSVVCAEQRRPQSPQTLRSPPFVCIHQVILASAQARRTAEMLPMRDAPVVCAVTCFIAV